MFDFGVASIVQIAVQTAPWLARCCEHTRWYLVYFNQPEGGIMNLTISGHHLDITPALRDHVTNKINKVTRYFDQTIEARVLLSIDNQKDKDRKQRAECTMRIKGNDLRAESAHQDMYAAIDDMLDKLDRQLMRHKEKLKSHAAESAKRMPQPNMVPDDA